MEDWSAVSADVIQVLLDEGFVVTLRKKGVKSGPASAPTYGPPVDTPIRVLQRFIRVRDSSGMLTGETRRTLLMGAGGPVPAKNDHVIFPDLTDSAVVEIRPMSPANVVIGYRLDLAT